MTPIHNKTVFVLDAHGILHQLFHALPEMSSPQGEPVGVVFGFARDLIKLIAEHKPDYIFCAYDLPGGTFRNTIYPQYKDNRKEMPESLPPQIGFSRDVLAAFDIPVLAVQGFEADDVMATIATMVEKDGGKCVLVTADKDCRQLLSDNVSLFNLRKQEFYTAKELLADWGIKPNQVVDFQSLVGDSSDNVPGVPLIGPKIATELLQKYETLENVLDHADEISGAKRKQNLLEGRKIAEMSRELVELRKDVPLDCIWKSGKFSGVDPANLKTMFNRFGFYSLTKKIPDIVASLGANPESQDFNDDDAPLFRSQNSDHDFETSIDDFQTDFVKIDAKYHLVDTTKKFDVFLAELSKQKCFSFDTETTNIRPRFAKIVGMSFCWDDANAWYLPLMGPLGDDTLDAKSTIERLKPVLENPEIGKVGQNLKYEIIVLKNAGIEFRGIEFDTIIADYLLRSGEFQHNLDELADIYLGHETIKIDELIGSGKKQKLMNEVRTEAVCDYAGEDALIPWLLRPILEKRLKSVADIWPLYIDWELPLAEILAQLEFTGIAIDQGVLKKLSVRFSERLHELEKEIHEIAETEFNVASPRQLQTILFDKLGLPVIKKTKTGPSTDIEVLEELASKHELPSKIIEHRQLSKLKGTYVDALPELIHPETHRIHTSFNQVVVATGRLSSSDPNLQNIPIRSEEGREIRSAFVPDTTTGFDHFLSCDYSQIELRVLAHFSEDENLRSAFASGEDIHTSVAAQVFGVPTDEVNKDMRRKAKAVNFGVIYGQSAFGLSKQLGITNEEAAAFIDAYFTKYHDIRSYLDEILDGCLRNKYVSTLLGRRRAISGVRPVRKGGQMNLPERTAVNTVIQGSAADLMKQAMVRVFRRLKTTDLQSRMLLQIHDELVFEVKHGELDKLKKLVIEEMSLDQPLTVPLVIDTKTGKNWNSPE